MYNALWMDVPKLYEYVSQGVWEKNRISSKYNIDSSENSKRSTGLLKREGWW